MLFIERIIILILLISFSLTAFLIVYSFIQTIFYKQKAALALERALRINSKKDLENVLIIHDKSLDAKTKEKIRIRIDDIVIDEDDAEVSYKSKDSL